MDLKLTSVKFVEKLTVTKAVLQNMWRTYTCKVFSITHVSTVEKYLDQETTCMLIFQEHIKIPSEFQIKIQIQE